LVLGFYWFFIQFIRRFFGFLPLLFALFCANNLDIFGRNTLYKENIDYQS